MSEVKKSAISFKSSDGKNTVAAYIYTCADVQPKGIVQISHGMCEYIGRYDDFAAYLARGGYIVCGNDHLGHGGTSDGEAGLDGYMAEKDGHQYVLRDLHHMNTLISQRYPGLPIILLGHSMGSFFARLYAATYPETIKGLIISGTGGPNPLGGVGLALTSLLTAIRGGKHRSKLIHNMAFGAYLKRIDNPATPYDWISRDKEIVAAYAKDKKCTFMFTVSAFHDLMYVLNSVSSPAWAEKLDKQTPVYIFSGDADPVGDYGEGVRTVYGFLQDAGVQDVTLKLYEGGRHEMLNETNRTEVYADVLAWCDAHLAP